MGFSSRFTALTVAICGFALAPAPAGAATIQTLTSRAGALALIGNGAQQIGFEDVRFGLYNGIGIGNIGFNTPTGTAMTVDARASGTLNTLGAAINNSDPTFGFSTLNFNFGVPASAFGFFFGGSSVDWTLTAFDGAGNLLESLILPPTGTSNQGNFFDIRANGIVSARLTQSGAGSTVFLDDFTYSLSAASGVPEPMGWALLVTGFGLVGGVLRRPRQTPTYRA